MRNNCSIFFVQVFHVFRIKGKKILFVVSIELFLLNRKIGVTYIRVRSHTFRYIVTLTKLPIDVVNEGLQLKGQQKIGTMRCRDFYKGGFEK